MMSVRRMVVATTLWMLLSSASAEKVLMTEVFAIRIEPTMFNWTIEDIMDRYMYQPSLINAPDLPSWMSYVYSDLYHSGFLYGVPPNLPNEEFEIEIIALNKKYYETRRVVLPVQVTEKLNPAKHEVQLKIDNLNVEDMFDVERMDALKDIFRKKLWKDSQSDLYVTFLVSAVKLGARLPLKPNEKEGVVIRLGSVAPLSNELIELQEEVKPLWKVPSCPRDFKRTTVERLFRESDFALDWCTFRLLEDKSDNEELKNNINEQPVLDRWMSVAKSDVPERSYASELAVTIIVPVFLMVLLVTLLSLILCFYHDDLVEEPEENFAAELPAPNWSPKPTTLLRSIANQDGSGGAGCLSPEAVMLSRSLTGSPTSTINRGGMHCRPSPPPYVRPKNKPGL